MVPVPINQCSKNHNSLTIDFATSPWSPLDGTNHGAPRGLGPVVTALNVEELEFFAHFRTLPIRLYQGKYVNVVPVPIIQCSKIHNSLTLGAATSA